MEKRLFEGKYGYFTKDGCEYVVTNPNTPRPWVNIISNGDYGLIVSQAGGGFSWRNHVNLNRLTRWYQDLIRDDWGKWLYLRNIDSGQLYSLAYQPVQAPYLEYKARHGLGYTSFEQKFPGGLKTKWTLFPVKDKALEIWICSIANDSEQEMNLELSSYLEWNLGAAPDINREFHKLFINTEYHEKFRAITAQKALWEVESDRGHWNTEWPYIGFHAVSEPVSGWDAGKDGLIGRNGSYMAPKGISQGKFAAKSGRFEDAAASLAVHIKVAPHSEKTVIYVLGQSEIKGAEDWKSLIHYYTKKENAQQALSEVKAFWAQMISESSVESPDEALNILTNVWLKYQSISGHLWARTGYYQQSGAFGFRDQLQTSQVWLSWNPAGMKAQLLLNAAHQFESGKVLHWWHPITEKGLPTEMSDDLLWLPFLTVKYLKETADFALLQESVPFYKGKEKPFLDHCLAAIEASLRRFSPRGLPLIGEGDWCDGFSAVGIENKGESIWLGIFLYRILVEWAQLLPKISSDLKNLADRYAERAEALKIAVNTHGWNGCWYIAATRDDGKPIGDPSQEEAKIYLMSQTWAILSDIADPQRKKIIAEAMLKHLETETGLMLLYPAFTKPDKYIGYITRYAPSLRENGGVYTHASTWGIMALAKMGMAEDALRIFSKMNPILHGMNHPDQYMAEPYVLPGNSDGKDSPYTGRAGWTWYTGSAGWLYTIVNESIAGIQADYNGLILNPCLSPHWPDLKITRPWRGAQFKIHYKNPHKKCGGISHYYLNGKRIEGNRIAPQPAGEYYIEAILGE